MMALISVEVLHSVERKTGYRFEVNEAASIFDYSIRKLMAIGKDYDYLPILFETELVDYLMRKEINGKGE